MVCHRDPKFLCSSTKTIRQFFGLATDGSRCLRIIVFRRLRPIKELKEKEMLTAYLQCFFCHFCLWKKGIRHGDISLGNLMWDDRRKVGILNDFDLARFADQTGASGQDNTGTLPFMALDLLSEEGLRGEIPRRYRHEAESFAWTLICLCLATHPNAKDLACVLHKYWLDRYVKQFPRPTKKNRPGTLAEKFNISAPTTPAEVPRYEEPEDDQVFRELLVKHEVALDAQPLEEIWDELVKMGLKYSETDWTA
ncbi:hypothetical protein BDM02DRAFT_3151168 [Thelephora ganbajun]|uniref:Uncharacterized protein n=1 Tax=Thelephora ganbajun TaxID=370292 RepID=A0ACB6Z2W3_THEGA|nr:hypothetical protein BDM02DRAFT_3151168 [Thelephora ganbajun]